MYGDKRNRERLIWNAEHRNVCPDCQAAEDEKEKQDARNAGLPDLKGSEKQVRWALSLRKSALKWAAEYVADIVNEHGEDSLEAYVARSSYDEYAAHSYAKYWIENRGDYTIKTEFYNIVNRRYEEAVRDEAMPAEEATC